MTAGSSDEDEETLFDVSPPGNEDKQALLKEKKERSGKKNVGVQKSKYPRTIPFILVTEFCERFNFYGMKAILVIYLTDWMELPYHRAVAIFHSFVMLAYFSPIGGAIIADSYLGRYKTILYISLVYALGSVVLSLTAFPPPHMYGAAIGLLLIGLGTGGIKPCVCTFGGDQFDASQSKEQQTFFSAFYFMINLGSMLSTFFTPMLRADVHCVENSCYPLAFGVPALLMLASVVIFFLGRKHYKHIPPTENVYGRVFHCVKYGLHMRLKHGKSGSKDGQWLDHAADRYEESFVTDVKALLHVLWLFLPFPLFWALFDQQGSRWTLQAVDMNGQIGFLGRVKPDQVHVLNPFLILVFIPLFDRVIYPLLDRVGIPNRPLQRMSMGMIMGCTAFVIAGFLQIKMEALHEPTLNGQSGVTLLNTADCAVNVKAPFFSGSVASGARSEYLTIQPGLYSVAFSCDGHNSAKRTSRKSTSEQKEPSHPSLSSNITVELKGDKSYRLVLHRRNSELVLVKLNDLREKDRSSQAMVSIINYVSDSGHNSTIILQPSPVGQSSATPTEDGIILKISVSVSSFRSMEPGRYDVFVDTVPTKNLSSFTPAHPAVYLGTGSVHTLVLERSNTSQVKVLQFASIEESQVSVLWLVPQYVFITIAEILFSVTGFAFAYTQAPASMKSIVQAAWLLTTALGDLIVVIIAEAQFTSSQSAESFLFAALMGVDTLLFVVMACRYKSYVPPKQTPDPVKNMTTSNGADHDQETQPLSELNSSKWD
ncbi:solute carrier family 15 member 2 [Aplysia californica]|uniref:Solute carrier family 15 member 2 n=1 Tax=Aplysia californica TaxID=6500 RepID=A0ABM0JMD3_APLCA|nr:solute carrier family 15 member 2 [Aplysia californica]XP_012937223.2 solute carrier family 15 member 2 [Aplysia californica]